MQRRFGQVLIPGVVVLLAVAGCSSGGGDGGGRDRGGRDGGGQAEGGQRSAAPDGRAVGPLQNPDGTKPGLGPVTTAADKAAARRIIDQLLTKGRGPRTGYERDKFGYAWMDTADGVPLARNGCDTRIISIIHRVNEAFAQLTQGVVGCAY
ncbi:hypothetical protein ACWY4P_31545 [Streptomyces sp. LZ34]